MNPNIQKMDIGRKSNQRWLWYAVDHTTNTVLAYVFGRRKDEVFKKLKELLEPFGIEKFYTDDWGAYERPSRLQSSRTCPMARGIDKSKLTETDIITKFILPAIKDSGWDDMTQIRQEVKLRDGKVVVRGRVAARKKVKSADIVLYYKPCMPLAVIEAKANKHEIGKGMQQGLDYARLLDVTFVFASNGDGFIFHDKTNPTQLDNFINPKKPYPVIATTSELMTTGVDAKTCKLVVLDQNIQSMTKFKQIIGRGTRIDDRFGKLWFTILDFKKATELFADERFDGIPERVIDTKPDDINNDDSDLESLIDGEDFPAEQENLIDEGEVVGEESGEYNVTTDGDSSEGEWGDDDDVEGEKVRKFHVNGVTVKTVAERVQYYDTDGKLVTESYKDYTRKTIAKQFASLDEFTRKWNGAERKQAIIDELEAEGILWEVLEQEVGKELDPFDLICHVVYDQPPLTRKERADNVKKRNYFTKYSETAQTVLNSLLDKYADEGVLEIENKNVLKVAPFTEIGRPIEIVKKGFGKPADYEKAISELEAEIYRIA